LRRRCPLRRVPPLGLPGQRRHPRLTSGVELPCLCLRRQPRSSSVVSLPLKHVRATSPPWFCPLRILPAEPQRSPACPQVGPDPLSASPVFLRSAPLPTPFPSRTIVCHHVSSRLANGHPSPPPHHLLAGPCSSTASAMDTAGPSPALNPKAARTKWRYTDA
jgi:hypothetical protein